MGCGGFVGVPASMGVTASPSRVICQVDGDSFRVPTARLVEAMEAGPALRRLLLRYAAFTLRNASQGVACNTLHTTEARASRWMLVVHDQVGRDEFPMTPEFLAYMLGVRRQTVTVIAGALQSAGMIRFRRGNMVICDREALEEAACECYATIRAIYQGTVD